MLVGEPEIVEWVLVLARVGRDQAQFMPSDGLVCLD